MMKRNTKTENGDGGGRLLNLKKRKKDNNSNKNSQVSFNNKESQILFLDEEEHKGESVENDNDNLFFDSSGSDECDDDEDISDDTLHSNCNWVNYCDKFDHEISYKIKRKSKKKMTNCNLKKTEDGKSISEDEIASETEINFTPAESGNSERSGKPPSFPPTYLVLRLAHNIRPSAVSWLVKKIKGKREEGGAELLVRCEPFTAQKKECLVLHITASKLKFLEMADMLDLKKRDVNGNLSEFSVTNLDNFLHGDINLDNLLTAAEKQMIIQHELENLRTFPDEAHVPGYPKLNLYAGQSVLQVFLQHGFITTFYPLHNEAELSQLGEKWYLAFFQSQPFEEIRQYFGEAIALYFSFLGYYTASLLAPAILSLIYIFLPDYYSSHTLIFFCIFNLVWSTIFLETWKRKCSELAFVWGTLRSYSKWEDPRPNFRGDMKIDPVTGRFSPFYPWWKTFIKVYCVSFPIVLTCLLGAFWIMLYSFWAEEMLIEQKHRHGSKTAAMIIMLPSIVYSVLVWFMNFYYRQVANFLTEWENHRTQSQFERHRVTKLVLFEFVNNFMSLFYIAFYIQDFEMLKSQVTVMLIVIQAISQFQEALLPLVIRKGYSALQIYLKDNVKCPKVLKKNAIIKLVGLEQQMSIDESIDDSTDKSTNNTQIESIWSPKSLGLLELDPCDPRIETSKREGEMDPYEGTFDDYLEMFIQFGYVFLFSAVYPLAAVFAILNNVLEIRADAFKLCKVFQRPLAKRVKDIGAWQIAFESMGAIAVMTNCALMSLSLDLKSVAPTMRPAEWLLLFVAIEHLLIFINIALRKLIPDMPSWVKVQLARVEFQSRLALKNERTFKAKRQLTRRFKTIHIAKKKFVPDTPNSPSSSSQLSQLQLRKNVRKTQLNSLSDSQSPPSTPSSPLVNKSPGSEDKIKSN